LAQFFNDGRASTAVDDFFADEDDVVVVVFNTV
jgi:hypothetical protein